MTRLSNQMPAFPMNKLHEEEANDGFNGYNSWTHGMTIRDFFAGCALASGRYALNEISEHTIAKLAYKMAQEMIDVKDDIEEGEFNE